uniref:RdRp n=1 Tax=viral metagenome TaxID=1070528 RepID=A0A2V0RAV0_9ZZZZ
MHIETAVNIPKRALPFLSSISNGYNVDVRTPLFNGEDRSKVADHWMSILSRNEEVFPELMEYESSQQSKIGPLSVRQPFTDRRSLVEDYYSNHRDVTIGLSELDFGNLPEGRRLRPISTLSSARQLPHGTNSGLPFFSKRRSVLEESISLADKFEFHPALLGWRGQSNGTPIPKQRVVWMFPFALNIAEARYFRPLHNELSINYQFAAWESMDEVDIMINSMFARERTILSSDFSSYDQSLFSQQDWFFDYLVSRYQRSYEDEINELRLWFKTIPLVFSENEMFTGEHGVPSGSTFTNQCDSIVNYLAQRSSPVVDSTTPIQVQGDDAVIIPTDIEKHLEFMNNLGFEMNADKQLVSDTTVNYLQRLYHVKYRPDGVTRGVYPTMRALNSLLGQERYFQDWSSEMVSLRVIAILENVKWHPAFEDFVKFVVEFGDSSLKDNIRKAIIDNSVIDKAMAIPGLSPTYNQESGLRGLKSFKSVQILMSL